MSEAKQEPPKREQDEILREIQNLAKTITASSSRSCFRKGLHVAQNFVLFPRFGGSGVASLITTARQGNGAASGQFANVRVMPRHGRVAVADDAFHHGQRRVAFAAE